MNSVLELGEPAESWTEGVKRVFEESIKQPMDKLTKSTEGAKYNHDRCERTVQMQLYVMQKPQFTLIFVIFLVFNGLFAIIGLAGPPITSRKMTTAKELTNSTDLLMQMYKMNSPTLSTYCQQLWIIVKIVLIPISVEMRFETKFNFTVEISGVSDDNLGMTYSYSRRHQPAKLTCRDNDCDEITVAHIGFLDFKQYKIMLQFSGLENFRRTYGVANVNFYFKSYNPSFSRLTIWFRFLFVIVSFSVAIWFYSNLRPYPVELWAMEQSWMAYLLLLFILYNNPLYPLIFLVNSCLPSVIDALFQVTFMCSLLLFWLVVYHGIRQRTRKFNQFYLPKLITVGCIWLIAATLSVWDRYNSTRDPAYYTNNLNVAGFDTFKVFFYFSGSAYLFYLIFLVGKAFKELRSLPYFGPQINCLNSFGSLLLISRSSVATHLKIYRWLHRSIQNVRLKFFTLLMLFTVIVTVTESTMKYGVAPVLEDNFVAQLPTEYGSSVEFLSFYAFINSYIIIMAYVYAPSASVVSNSNDIALVENDSEDELYGMNYEEKKRKPVSMDDDSDE